MQFSGWVSLLFHDMAKHPLLEARQSCRDFSLLTRIATMESGSLLNDCIRAPLGAADVDDRERYPIHRGSSWPALVVSGPPRRRRPGGVPVRRGLS